MKHYPHHIGDFDKETRHLTRIERSVYRDLIDLYYAKEQRLTLDMAALCRKIIARTDEESTAVEQVLNEFFEHTNTGWYHDRCEIEIAAYRANTSQKAMAGKASAEAKRLKKQQDLEKKSTAVELPLPDVETESQRLATNQSTINQSTNEPVLTPLPPEGLEGGLVQASDVGRVCKAMRQCGISSLNTGNPTLRALLDAGATDQEFVDAANKAVSEQKGFAYALGIVAGERKRAAAIAEQIHRGALPAAETTYQRSMRERMQEVAPEAAKRDPNHAAFAAEFFNAIEVPTRTVERLE